MSGWTAPSWLRQYEGLLIDTGGRPVEELMNVPNAHVSDLLTQDPVVARSVLANTQVALLTALRARGLLLDVPACPLEGKR